MKILLKRSHPSARGPAPAPGQASSKRVGAYLASRQSDWYTDVKPVSKLLRAARR